MAVARPIFAIASLVLLAGACLFMFFIMLSGAVNGNPVNQWYFLQADTSSIQGAPATARWTFWNAAQVAMNGTTVIPSVQPAYPFDPQNNFGTQQGVPAGFIGTNQYYYMTRFMFAFALIALFFAIISLFLGFLALCSRIGSYLSSVMCFIALTFQTIVAALMTAAYVKGRNEFRNAGLAADIGNYAFGFEWAAVACLFLCSVFFCIGGSASKSSNDGYQSKRGMFGRKKSVRERGSFIDTESQRPIN